QIRQAAIAATSVAVALLACIRSGAPLAGIIQWKRRSARRQANGVGQGPDMPATPMRATVLDQLDQLAGRQSQDYGARPFIGVKAGERGRILVQGKKCKC